MCIMSVPKIGAPARERTPKAFAQTNPEPRAELDMRGALTPSAPNICGCRVTISATAAGLTTARGGIPAHVIACRLRRGLSPRPRADIGKLGGGLLLRPFSFFHSKRFRYMVARGDPRGSTCGYGVARGSDRFIAARNAAYIHPFAQLHTACSSRGRCVAR